MNAMTPIEELIGFLKQADNYTQDTREWPDPTEPRASKPPEPEGCTCAQGNKLDCPIHGMHADPELQELDHTWSMPHRCHRRSPSVTNKTAHVIWTQAVSHFSPRNGRADDAGDTSSRGSQKNPHDPSQDSNNHPDVPQSPELLRVRDHRQSRRFVPFGIEELEVPKFRSFVVGNGQGESIDILDQRVDMENGFLSFGPLKHVTPISEHLEDDLQRVGRRVVDGSSFGVHHSTPPSAEEFIVNIKQEDHIGNRRSESQDQTNQPQHESHSSDTGNIDEHAKPSDDISDREEICTDEAEDTAHKWSVTRIGLKVRSYKLGKYGKGMIQSEEAPEAQIWRVRGGWNGAPHHGQMQEVLGIVRPMIAFHIDKRGIFYFHEKDEGFAKPKDPAKLAQEVETQYPELQWGRKSAEEYEQRNDQQHDDIPHTAALSQLTQAISSMQTPKEARRLVIRRDQEGRMASIEEVPIT